MSSSVQCEVSSWLSRCMEIAPKDGLNHELEISLGKIQEDGSFVSGVDYKHFVHILKCLSGTTCSKWKSHENGTELIRSYYEEGSLRRTVWVGGSRKPIMQRKRRLAHIDIKVANRKFDLRISMSIEEPAHCNQESVMFETPQVVRMYKRWSVVHDETWRYDMSKTATGDTREDACSKHPKYEVEVELDNWKCSEQMLILEKGLDLIGRWNSRGEKQPFMCEVIRKRFIRT